MTISGLIIAVFCFLCIGVFHPIVIKAEYYFTKKCWFVFLIAGAAAITASLFISHIILSAVVGVFGCCCLWSIFELFEQEKRVQRGWFPKRERKSISKSTRAASPNSEL